MEDKLFGLEIKTPAPLQEIVEGYLYLLVPWGWESIEPENEDGNATFKLLFTDPIQAENVHLTLKKQFSSIQITPYMLKNKNWLENWKKFFTPIPINNTFIILPSWENQKTKQHPDLIPILIHPEMAFGTGHHATTYLCLKLIANLKHTLITQNCFFLDLGTGSGILGLGCALLGLRGQGIDIDPQAINNATYNRSLNQISPEQFNILLTSIEKIKQKFSLIIANILADPLIQMAQEIKKHLLLQGHLILSGILKEQAPQVITIYTKLGLKLIKELTLQEWSALYFRHE
ncbi:MAG: 50S ribosomal protein L11 methyltransferase [Desulfonauticus sp.]|nr:50S ribosomal protein L11 methyltransferase [Desulfonauticus sp.]